MKLFSFALLASVSLFVSSAGICQAPERPVHLTFFYFRDVADQVFSDRPIQMSATRDPKTGREQYWFLDRRTNQKFRDGAQIQADMAQASASRSHTRLRELGRELGIWRIFLRGSPVIVTEAD